MSFLSLGEEILNNNGESNLAAIDSLISETPSSDTCPRGIDQSPTSLDSGGVSCCPHAAPVQAGIRTKRLSRLLRFRCHSRQPPKRVKRAKRDQFEAHEMGLT